MTHPFQQAGILTVNFIDWNDPHRHKLSDTFDKLRGKPRRSR